MSRTPAAGGQASQISQAASTRLAKQSETEQSGAFSWRFVTPLYMGSAFNPLNSTLIATALVPIAHSMGVSVGRTAVLVSVLYLASSVAQPTFGKLSEELGPRRVFLAGIVLVLVGGLIGGLAPSLMTLIISRAVIGIGTSAGYPSAMVLVRRRAARAGLDAPPGKILGGLALVSLTLIAVGPPLGGLLVGLLGWRSTFFLNVPFALAGLVMTVLWVPRDPAIAVRGRLGEITSRVDVPGIAGFGGMMTALLVFLLGLPHVSWAPLAITALIGTALVLWELRATTPFLDVRQLVSNGALMRTYLRGGLTFLGLYTVLYGLTQWLEAGHGYFPEAAGLLILPMGALAALASLWVSRRNLIRWPLIVTGASMLAASLLTLLLNGHSPAVLIIAVTLGFGVTMGTTTVGNQTALYTQAPPAQLGTAAGLFRTFGYVGSIASSTITGIVFHTGVTDSGLHSVAWILVGVSFLVLVMTLADRRLPLRA
ncbi:MFS transporter [Streptomyces sp. NPDC090088]|uniref:MFS transporter n=1 Tax=Streptomyces sp. NPDC090088 TaxID=3365944 RepID=UPI0037F58CB7